MIENPESLAGMSAAAAREYIFGFAATLKITEKEIRALEEEAAKWKNRVDLARSRASADLLAEAEKQVERIAARLEELQNEERGLKEQIETMRRQLPGLAARERSVDPDVLQQEILMALGSSDEEAATEAAFIKMEKEAASDAALSALKARMKEI